MRFLSEYRHFPHVRVFTAALAEKSQQRIRLKGLAGSAAAVIAASCLEEAGDSHLFILSDKESAAYFFNDLEHLSGEQGLMPRLKKTQFFPTSYKKHYNPVETDSANLLSRSEVLNRFALHHHPMIVVTYPEALCEKVLSGSYLRKSTLSISVGENLSLDFLTDVFAEYGFERTEFVIEPGQFSLRGGIADVFSYADDLPYRIEFNGDEIESLRRFDPATQLSKEKLKKISILPNVHDRQISGKRQSILSLFAESTLVWTDDMDYLLEKLQSEYEKVCRVWTETGSETGQVSAAELFISPEAFMKEMLGYRIIEFGKLAHFETSTVITFDFSPQKLFHKNFDLLVDDIRENADKAYLSLILTSGVKQEERIRAILNDLLTARGRCEAGPDEGPCMYKTLELPLHEGFTDHLARLAVYTDHQLFDRHHRFQLRDSYSAKEALTIRDLYALKPGDYVTHIDHGIGRFDGLEKIENNGREQEAIRLIYQNNDLLYVSIHSLHRIAKYTGKEGTPPNLHRLGSNYWARIKENTKKKVKDIAKDLIRLYAERRRTKGFSFMADTYLQHELEASFIFEDTPDQIKATADIKKDMENDFPMDRLVCGDVGFGKTEVAIRAAFKAVTDSKQVAVLVPTTILALQHYRTFTERLEKFPCKVEYINRFRSTKDLSRIIGETAQGKVDILIGTHRILSQDIKFKELGLMIVDEEQKFGVAAKEKLKKMRVSVDTLTLTATPIPRTLQFSLMGARDLSVINTPPPNRQPVQTEIRPFSEETIRDGIIYELSRNGQVFFVHTRVQNIMDVAAMIQKYVPDARIAVAHGQMEGHKLEKVMMDYIDGRYDVLVSTTIVESGLDIPNANTIFINDAHHYGLSDLHQLRGRVGRSNRKAFCYLLAPPMSVLTDEARKRIRAIEEFADLGSGFNIAMRDLDIRGAGNLLGAEQSGFINEIGYEMYLKILDDAVIELKETEFGELFSKELEGKYVRDCNIETDLEILIPTEYVSNTIERLNLYKELDALETDEGILSFQEKLIDRFGPIPHQVTALFNTLRLRWLAKGLGFEKIVLRNNTLTGFFVSNPESPYYQSEQFNKVLDFVLANPSVCRMKEGTEKLSLSFKGIQSPEAALEVLRGM